MNHKKYNRVTMIMIRSVIKNNPKLNNKLMIKNNPKMIKLQEKWHFNLKKWLEKIQICKKKKLI